MEVKIIGGGIYGCHLSLKLKELGYDIKLIESNQKLFQGASGNNQFRLHHGFHYPRNSVTRRQSLEGFQLFKGRYGEYCKPISENLYAVVRNESVTDFETYKTIMQSDSLEFCEYEPKLLNTALIEGTLNTNEEILDLGGLAKYFEAELDGIIEFGRTYNLEEDFGGDSLVIDCTWDATNRKKESYFEPTLLFYYQLLNTDLEDWSLTLVDGNFWSLYKTSIKSRFTLSHVMHSALGSYTNMEEAKQKLNTLTNLEMSEIRKKMEIEVFKFLSIILEFFEYVEPQFSVKTKKFSASANRACEVEKNENLISVRSGKLDTIFFAESEVLRFIGQFG